MEGGHPLNARVSLFGSALIWQRSTQTFILAKATLLGSINIVGVTHRPWEELYRNFNFWTLWDNFNPVSPIIRPLSLPSLVCSSHLWSILRRVGGATVQVRVFLAIPPNSLALPSTILSLPCPLIFNPIILWFFIPPSCWCVPILWFSIPVSHSYNLLSHPTHHIICLVLLIGLHCFTYHFVSLNQGCVFCLPNYLSMLLKNMLRQRVATRKKTS